MFPYKEDWTQSKNTTAPPALELHSCFPPLSFSNTSVKHMLELKQAIWSQQ